MAYRYRRDAPNHIPKWGAPAGPDASAPGAAAGASGGRGVLRRKRQARILAVLCMTGALFQYASVSGVFEQTMPNARILRRMLMSKYFGGNHGGADDERYLSKSLGGGDCDWLAPVKLNATYNPPRTLLVSYPGSGKRLTWRMIESLTGYRTGDDWDLSEEGKNVATMKTSYPHPEGIWSWGDRLKDAEIVLLIRNPRWAIPSYQTMRHELDYSTSWDKSYVRRPNTYTVRPDLAEWENWRGDTWPNDYKRGNAEREIDRWAWFIDFWMRDGLRRNDGEGNPIQDAHCRNESTTPYFDLSGNPKPHMATCKPSVLISFEKLYDPTEGLAESRKLASALEDGRPDMPIIEPSARDCVFTKTKEKRGTEERWDNSARDGDPSLKGPPSSEKKFTWLQLQQIKSELERLIANYTVEPWTEDPIANDLVSNLNVYLADVDAEIDITNPYTWWPTSSPTEFPTFNPTAIPTSAPTAIPTPEPTFKPTAFPTLSPTPIPTDKPTPGPTAEPTFKPTAFPTASPTFKPTAFPTASPTFKPTAFPTLKPTPKPTAFPTTIPTALPTRNPTRNPTALPTFKPTTKPTANPVA